MRDDDLAKSEEQSMHHLARSILDQLNAGRSQEDIVRDLHGNGWELEDARDFVAGVEERKDELSQSLAVRFPEMRPLRRQPALFTINGFGVGLYGKRDHDPATRTYVKTHCLCAVFVPVLAFGAYRVAKAPGASGWYLIGKTPLSRFAKCWNVALLVGVLGLIGLGIWHSHTETPEYRSAQAMREAEEAARSGDVVTAVRKYHQAAQISFQKSSEARDKIQQLIDPAKLAKRPHADVMQLFSEAAPAFQNTSDADEMFDRGAVLVKQYAATDPADALDLLARLEQLSPVSANQLLNQLLEGPLARLPVDQLVPLYQAAFEIAREPADAERVVTQGLHWLDAAPDADPRQSLALVDLLASKARPDMEAVQAARLRQLERAVAAEPTDVDLAVRLAVSLEDGKHTDRIKTLLKPLQSQLGTGEGARLLGQILAAEGAFDESYALLHPYLDAHLSALHDAEKAFENALISGQERIVQELKSGMAGGFDYAQYDSLDEQEQQSVVGEYINSRLKDDGAIADARSVLQRRAVVVPVAIDLGMVILRRAQDLKDPAAREKELKKAEETLLSVQGIAGESDQWRLQVGQVYYWLGKQKEGQAEFDKLLAKHDRSFEILVPIAGVLREIGALSEARRCLEEAYEKATDDQQRHDVARQRASTQTDLQDEIAWLEKCNQSLPDVRAAIASTRGQQAAERGDNEAAAELLRESVTIYETMVEDSTTLNNSALVLLSLHRVTGDPAVLKQGISRLQKSIAMRPDNAILLGNASFALISAVVDDLAGRPLVIHGSESLVALDLLDYVVANNTQLEQLRDKARRHATLRQAREFLDKTMMLAPRNPSPYQAAVGVYGFLLDTSKLERLLQRTKQTTFDMENAKDRYIKYLQFQEDASDQQRIVESVTKAQRDIQQLQNGDDHVALAVAVGRLADASLVVADAATINGDRLVKLAEQVHTASPSLGTYSTLIQVLLTRASVSLGKQFPEFGAAANKARRSLSPMQIVSLAAARQDDLGATVRDNVDVRRSVQLMLERNQLFPRANSPTGWALCQALKRDETANVAEHIAADKTTQLMREISMTTYPWNVRIALDEYYARSATGHSDSAPLPLNKARELGAPMPAFLFDSVTKLTPNAEQGS